MNTSEILAAYDAELRQAMQINDAIYRVDRTATLTRLVGPSPEPVDNCVIYARLTPATADAVIAEQIAYFRGLGHGFEWKHHEHDEPSDLAERLTAHGFQAEEPESLAILDLSEDLGLPVEPPGIRIDRLTDPARFDDVDRVSTVVWAGSSAWRADALRAEHAADPDALQVYVAYDGDKPVTACWIRFHKGTGFGSLWGGSTLAEYRGRGIYKALVKRRAQEARTRGFRWLTVDASPDSRPILERLGFQIVTRTTPYIWTP